MSSPNDLNPLQTPTRSTQTNNWIQMQTEMPIRSPTGYGFPTPSPPPQGYGYPSPPYPTQPQAYPSPPHFPNQYPNQPQQSYYVPQPQSFHPQQTYTELLTQNDGLDTINPSFSQPQSQIPSSQSSQAPTEDMGKKRKEKAKSVPWKQDECETLAKCWINISEDAIVSNDQKRSDFWNRVTAEFNTRMGKVPPHCRTKDQVYSKYQKMNADVAYFNDTYLSIIKSKPSGWNEAKIIQRVNKTFNTEKKKAFGYHTVWEILRNSAKWREDDEEEEAYDEDDDDDDDEPSLSKKSRTSESEFSDGRVGFNLNDEASPPPPQEPRRQRQPRARPMGRDRSKAQARGKARAKEVSPELAQNICGLNEKIDLLLQNEAEKKRQRDMKMLLVDTSGMTGQELEDALAVKAEIRARFNRN